jgi:hypothetical protein
MIAPLLAVLLAQAQDAPADAATRIVERHERAVRELEDSLVELGEAGLPEVQKLQDHPKAEVRDASGRALARIRKLAPAIKDLIEKLSADSPQERERATEDLMNLGPAARSDLEAAARGADREKALRAKGILLTLDPSGPRRVYWAARADLEERALAHLRGQVDLGRAPVTALDEAELRRLRARWKAGKIGSREYFTSKQDVLTKGLARLEKLYERGLIPSPDVLRSKLALAVVNRHLGKTRDEEVRRLQRQLWHHLAGLVEKGMLAESEALSQYAEGILDEDLDGGH